MCCKFPCFVLKPRERYFWYGSLAELPAARVTDDWWETGRGAERGRGDTDHHGSSCGAEMFLTGLQ